MRNLKKILLVVVLMFSINMTSHAFIADTYKLLEEKLGGVVTAVQGAVLFTNAKAIWEIIAMVDDLMCIVPQIDYYFDLLKYQDNCLINLQYMQINTNIANITDNLELLIVAIGEINKTEEEKSLDKGPLEIAHDALSSVHMVINQSMLFISQGKTYERQMIEEMRGQLYIEESKSIFVSTSR